MLSPDNALSPWILGAALLALLVLLTVNAIRKDRREYQRFKRLRTTRKRQVFYKRWLLQSFSLFGGSAVVTLALAWQFIAPMLDDVNSWAWIVDARRTFTDGGALAVGLAVGLTLLLVGGAVLGIVLAKRQMDDDSPAEVPSVGDIQALLPRNRAELKFGAALSVNAGVVEELLFRLAVPALIYGVTGNAITALTGSLLIFGLLHAYQGVAGILGSLLIGAVLMAIYIATGSILVAIIAHALFDLRSLVLIPVIVFGVHKQTGNNAPVRKARVTPAVPPTEA